MSTSDREKKSQKSKKGVTESTKKRHGKKLRTLPPFWRKASAPRPTYLLHASCGYGERKKLHLSDVFVANFPNDVNRSIAWGAEQISSQNRISHCSQN